MSWEAVEGYVGGLAEGRGAWITMATAARALGVLSAIRRRASGVAGGSVVELPPPQAAPGPDGLVGFTWRSDRDYLSIEVHADGHLEEFHEDLGTGALWSEDTGEPSDEFVRRLRLIHGR